MANRTHILFLHGGAEKTDFDADMKLVKALKSKLGRRYQLDYPYLPDTGERDMGRRKQIRHEIAIREDGLILVAHSLGASMLLACLSEFALNTKIAGVFLLATPWWDGDEDWVNAFKLKPDFEKKLDPDVPLFFYQCRDDKTIPYSQFKTYKRKLPWAVFRERARGGHQFRYGVAMVAKDILGLSSASSD